MEILFFKWVYIVELNQFTDMLFSLRNLYSNQSRLQNQMKLQRIQFLMLVCISYFLQFYCVIILLYIIMYYMICLTVIIYCVSTVIDYWYWYIFLYYTFTCCPFIINLSIYLANILISMSHWFLVFVVQLLFGDFMDRVYH